MITAGIDIGSVSVKGVLLVNGEIMATGIQFTGYNSGKAGESVFASLKESAGVDTVDAVVATGYGRNNVDFAHKTITEITCHAAGAGFLNKEVRTVIDVGGQDSKVISITEDGRVKDFAMNDKCAAGTGRFLEVMSRALELDLENFGGVSLKADSPSPISSTCAVFAETEVISLIARGEKRENIVAGIHESIARRVASLAVRVGVKEQVMMTGGVSKNTGAVAALEKALDVKALVTEYSQFGGALGAAVLAVKI